MEESRNAAEGAALGAFAAARCAEKEIGLIFHEQIALISEKLADGQSIPLSVGRGNGEGKLLRGGGLDVDTATGAIEPHLAVHEREDGVIATQADVLSGQK